MSATRVTRLRAVTARSATLPIQTTVVERQMLAASGTDRWIHHTPSISSDQTETEGPGGAERDQRKQSEQPAPRCTGSPSSDRSSRSTSRLIATP